MILGENHLYQRAVVRKIYETAAFDPEGPFGCILSSFHAFLGLQAGITLLTISDWKSRTRRFLAWGSVTSILGYLFSNFSGWIPINKSLWTLPYVLVTSGIGFFVFTVCYFFVDVKKMWNGSPFYWSGLNAILLYIGHIVLRQMLPWDWNIGIMNTHFILLVKAFWNTTLWMIIAYGLFKKQLFLVI